ncbi:MAG: stage V sporulation T C-terminal domain-containing protein, partial [bacterium]|nr:stage V sporulation T C-terminal domain-containing protein [bacterium]
DPLEIFTASDGEVIFKKYSAVGEMSTMASQYCDVLAKCTRFAVVICDRDHCIAAAGMSKKEVLERRVSSALEDIMESRKQYVYSNGDFDQPTPLEGVQHKAAVIVPIISAGDISGAVVLVCTDELIVPTESDIKLASVAAGFLGKQMEQ